MPTVTLGSDFITVREASRTYGYGTEYIRELIRKRELVAVKLNSTFSMVSKTSIEKYIKSLENKSHKVAGA